MKGHKEINCRVQNKGWIESGNEGREFESNPRTAQAKKQVVLHSKFMNAKAISDTIYTPYS